MGLLKKIFGICDTTAPADPYSWKFSGKQISIDLTQTPELGSPGGAVRLEGNGLSQRIFVIRDEKDAFHAFENKCSHMGRRLDPGDKPGFVKCCSVSGSKFDFSGNPVAGAAKKSIKTFLTHMENHHLVIDL